MKSKRKSAKPQGFTAITIIYNPNSTGESRKNAFAFKKRLTQVVDSKIITIIPTEYAGHAEEIAYRQALGSDRPFIVASSGDGGYHEVVNGALRAQAEGARVVTGLLPSGNANDHYRALHTDDTLNAIAAARAKTIDVLLLRTKKGNHTTRRYAHSYIGLGITPLVGAELNKATLSAMKEIWIVARTLVRATRVTVEVNGRRTGYTNLILSNIKHMSKVLTLAEDASVTDGKFEVNYYSGRSRLGLYGHMLRAAARSLNAQKRTDKFRFHTIKKTRLQLDGEIVSIPRGTTASVTCEQKLLRCIV